MDSANPWKFLLYKIINEANFSLWNDAIQFARKLLSYSINFIDNSDSLECNIFSILPFFFVAIRILAQLLVDYIWNEQTTLGAGSMVSSYKALYNTLSVLIHI